jgi:cyclophilin family peptidyl-prolyl cis-trans isomerase
MKKIFLLFSLAQLFLFLSCNSGTETGNAAETQADNTAAPASSDNTGTMVLIETDLGNIKIKLNDSTPQHRDNFIKLAKEGFYDGTLFHRIIPGFMIQGGDPDSKTAQPGQQLGMGGPGYTIPAEIGAKHFRGALAAARQPDQVNPQRASSGSQFYIVQNGPVPEEQFNQFAQYTGTQYSAEEKDYYLKYGGTPQLDSQYTVFGQVVEGLDVVDKIASVQRDQGDRPLQDIKMKVKIL